MGRLLLIGALFGLGCASSSHEMREAREHQYKADAAASRGDYHQAAREQDEAARKRQEAYDRARWGL